MARVFVPLPDADFDVTEVAVPWRLLTDAGHEVVFATERGGGPPAADPRLLSGVIFGRLGAAEEPRLFYRQLLEDPRFRAPVAWDAVEPTAFDGLLLPGGHAPGMRQYLGSELVSQKAVELWKLGRPVAAICHGVLVLARATDPDTGRSPLFGRRSTCLTKVLERSAYLATAWRLGRYFRTYPQYVETEVRGALARSSDFVRGPGLVLRRGTATDDSPAFVVEDDNYVSARWPGDAYLFARRFESRLARAARASRSQGPGSRRHD